MRTVPAIGIVSVSGKVCGINQLRVKERMTE